MAIPPAGLAAASEDPFLTTRAAHVLPTGCARPHCPFISICIRRKSSCVFSPTLCTRLCIHEPNAKRQFSVLLRASKASTRPSRAPRALSPHHPRPLLRRMPARPSPRGFSRSWPTCPEDMLTPASSIRSSQPCRQDSGKKLLRSLSRSHTSWHLARILLRRKGLLPQSLKARACGLHHG